MSSSLAIAERHETLRFDDRPADFLEEFTPAVFTDPDRMNSTLVYVMPDDRWTPTFAKGQLILVDTCDREPMDGALFVRRLEHRGEMSIVRLRKWDNNGPMKLVGRGSRGLHWTILYGAQRMLRVDGSPVPGMRPLHFADGPCPDKHLRPQLVGRVIGTLQRS